MKKTWIETDHRGVQWRVQCVTGEVARILTGRNSYLAYTRLTLRQADGCAGQVAPNSDVESGAAAAYTKR